MELLKTLSEWLGKVGKMIGMTEPRRATTRQILETIKSGLGLGRESKKVAYHVKHDNQSGPSTMLKLMTDGILCAELPGSDTLPKYSYLIIDEVHQRNPNTDVILLKLREKVRTPSLFCSRLTAIPGVEAET